MRNPDEYSLLPFAHMPAKACIHNTIDMRSTTSNSTKRLLLLRLFHCFYNLGFCFPVSFHFAYRGRLNGGCGDWLALTHLVEVDGCHVSPGLLYERPDVDEDCPFTAFSSTL
jgi:hypothetical protein